MTNPADLVALEIQEIFRTGRTDSEQGILRLDYTQEAAAAPFAFDMVSGTLHRAGCARIGRAAAGSLYALWRPGPEFSALACPKCRPGPGQNGETDREMSSDLLYGVLSIVDQFGSVLRQRGKEYRKSSRGRQLSRDLERLMSALDETQRESVSLAVTSLESLIAVLEQVNRGLERRGNGANGASPNGNGRRKASSNGNHRKEV